MSPTFNEYPKEDNFLVSSLPSVENRWLESKNVVIFLQNLWAVNELTGITLSAARKQSASSLS